MEQVISYIENKGYTAKPIGDLGQGNILEITKGDKKTHMLVLDNLSNESIDVVLESM